MRHTVSTRHFRAAAPDRPKQGPTLAEGRPVDSPVGESS